MSDSRQRVSRACDSCRKKKVKCDGARPVCTNCRNIGLECTFKDLTKKRGPPKGYIEAIENRLYKLENFLADLAKSGNVESKELLSELNSPLKTPTGEQIRARPIRRATRFDKTKVFFWQQDKAGKRKRESLMEQSSEDNHEEEEEPQYAREQSVDVGLGQLSMDENGQVRYLGKSSGYYLLQNSRTYQNGAFHFANYGNRPKKKRVLHVDPHELPPQDLSKHLIRLYFTHFYPFLPMFYNRQLFFDADSPSVPAATPLLLNAIYAVASRISPDMRVRSDPASAQTAGDVFFERAEKLLDESYDTPSISTVQALLLLSSHQHGAMKSARAWLYSGMAFRMAQDLGLHRNCDHWNISQQERERRKRVFWCCYIVDKLTCAMYGRASTLEEKDCDIPFPSVDDDELVADDPSFRLLEAFVSLIKICDILGHVLKHIYYVRSLQYTGARQADTVLTTWNTKLRQWKDQLPDTLHPNHASVAVRQLHMVYHTTVILLHRPFITSHQHLPSASICSAAADAIIATAMSMLAENKLRYIMNFGAYYIFTSSTIFIKHSSDEKKAKARQCLQILDEIEHTWPTASKSRHILAELLGLQDNPPWDVIEWNRFMDSTLNNNTIIHQHVFAGLQQPSTSTLLNYQPNHQKPPLYYW